MSQSRNNNHLQDYPPFICCPVSLDIMDKPMMLTCCGNSIDQKNLEQLLADGKSCPLCRKSLKENPPVENRNLESVIKQFKELYENYHNLRQQTQALLEKTSPGLSGLPLHKQLKIQENIKIETQL